MIGVFSSGVNPLVEFGVEYGKVKGVIAGTPAEPLCSGLDETRPSMVELRKYFCEVIGVRFMGLVIQVPPS
jgi:hypothetical protein